MMSSYGATDVEDMMAGQTECAASGGLFERSADEIKMLARSLTEANRSAPTKEN
jgi:hypothetical protein